MPDSATVCDWDRLRFQRPAFHASGLRLVGDMISDPVMRAITRDVIKFRGPVWSEEGRKALVFVGEKLSDAVAVAIGKGALPFFKALDWSRGYSALERIFELKRQPHLFRTKPIAWAKFTEPQFTKGFAYFLDTPAVRIHRIRALLVALGAAGLCEDMCDVEVTAEALTARNKRIDLLIEWKDSSKNRYAVAIEAKLDHHVTVGQLKAYRRHLTNRKISRERWLLAVVSPRRTARTDKSLQDNRDWRWMAWRDLLIAHERALPVECDDDAYLQFRRTLWDQALRDPLIFCFRIDAQLIEHAYRSKFLAMLASVDVGV